MEQKSSTATRLAELWGSLLFAPAVIAIGLIGIAFWVQDYIRSDQESQQWEELNSAAVKYSALLNAHIATRLDISKVVQGQWAAGKVTNEKSFREYSAAVQAIFDDFQAISWVDHDGVIRWVTPVSGNESAVGLDLMALPTPASVLAESYRLGHQQITPPLTLAQGGRGVVSYTPLYRGGLFSGYLNIVFRIQPLIQGALRDKVPDEYALTVYDSDVLLYSAGGETAAVSVFAEVPFSVGNRTWSVRVEPTATLVARNVSYIDELALGFGFLLSLSVSGLVYLLMVRQQTLRENEAYLRNILNHSPTPIYLKDLEGRYRVVNTQFQKTYGFEREDILGKTALDVFNDETAEAVLTDDIAMLGRNKASVNEMTFFGRTYLVSKFPIRAADGEMIGLGGIEVDITERQEMETQLKKSRADAIRANLAKSDFLAHMSHELRTPLNSILGFTETMATGFFGKIENPRYVDYLDTIMSSGHHLLSVINDILDLSKIEAGELEISPVTVCVPTVIEDSLSLFRGRRGVQWFQVEYDCMADLPKLYADARYLKQIILNLLSNAVKYSDTNSVVHIITAISDDDRISISIRDTGIGIRKEDISRVLEPFGQARSNSGKSHEGTGLGLSLSKQLTELHDGTLTLVSEFGVGTTVTIEFPPERTIRE